MAWALLFASLVSIATFVALARRRTMARSLGARTGQLGVMLTRSRLRKLRLRLAQLRASRAERARLEHQYHVTTAEEAARTLGQMKGVFMKIGQIVSFTNGDLPPEAQKALGTLQQSAPPMAFSLVRDVIQAELGAPPESLFAHVEHEPLAAASIGQVHRARLRDGSEVVLKVQYPGVDEAIRADLKATAGLAAVIGAVNRNIDAQAVVAELKSVVLEELDYLREARNQQLFGELWRGHPLVRVPRVFPEHSSARVLCQSYAPGLRFDDFVTQANVREKRLAVRVLHDFVFESMNRFCVFNGDPHPGNYVFHEDGGITFLDYGCIKYFEPAFIRNLQRMNRALIEGDIDDFERLCLELELVLPGRAYDRDKLWAFMRYNGAPVLEDRPFKFTRAWIQQARELMSPEHVGQMNLPRDFLFFNRITFGLNSLFERLEAEENFHAFNRRYLFDEERGVPSLALAGVELPARFLASTMEPARAR